MEIFVIFAGIIVVFLMVSFLFMQKGIKSQNKRLSQKSQVLFPVRNPRHQEALISLYEATTERAFCNSIKDVQTFGKQGLLTREQYVAKTKNLTSKLISHE